jgi:hypothetical protein
MADIDSMSELLVAQLLEEDLKIVQDCEFAEELQFLDQLFDDSSKDKGRHIPEYSNPLEDDHDIAARIFVEGFRPSSDHLCAQVLQHSIDASEVASQQFVQKLVAAEKNILLDAEFAKRLQDAEDNGQIATDNVKMLDAERYCVSAPHDSYLKLLKCSWPGLHRFCDGETLLFPVSMGFR